MAPKPKYCLKPLLYSTVNIGDACLNCGASNNDSIGTIYVPINVPPR